MEKNGVHFSVLVGLATLILIHGYEEKSGTVEGTSSSPSQSYRRRIESIDVSSIAEPPVPAPRKGAPSPPVYHVTSYGADPTGQIDSTDAILKAISDAFQPSDNRVLMQGIPDLGGSQVHLDGGSYKISCPLRMPTTGGGNLRIHGGSLRASDDFPTDRYLIELWPESVPKQDATLQMENGRESAEESFASSYEFITLRDLRLDSNYRGGGIAVINSLRTRIDNCYISNFTTDGIYVQGGHETFITNTFLGQHITAGGDPGEANFSGTAISLRSNDNALTDVVIFSAKIGVLIAGQANILTGVHCYNKATYWGGVGIYVQLPGFSQTRIVNCYMDYTGIVAEDPVQLHISNTFFLGNAYVLLKSVKGIVRGLNIVDNMFSGDGQGVAIVQLDQAKGPFTTIDQVIVDRNGVLGMELRSTVARSSVKGNGTTWTADFDPVLLFPNRITRVAYTLQVSRSFANHALRNVSGNRIVIESDVPVSATAYISVDQNSD